MVAKLRDISNDSGEPGGTSNAGNPVGELVGIPVGAPEGELVGVEVNELEGSRTGTLS